MDRYWIFVSPVEIDESTAEYAEVIEWSLKNLGSSNVLVLTSEDVYDLDYKSKVLDIINEENGSMLQWGENDWIFDRDVKLKIRERLYDYIMTMTDMRLKEIALKILDLLDLSISTERNLYVNF